MIQIPEMPADEPQGPDLTAVLDILFILLVFFLLTANSVEQALTVALPSTEPEAAQPLDQERSLRVVIDTNAWQVGERRVSDWQGARDALLAAIENDPDTRIVVQGAREAALERLVQLLGFLQSQGLSTANIQVQPAGPIEEPS